MFRLSSSYCPSLTVASAAWTTEAGLDLDYDMEVRLRGGADGFKALLL